MCSHVESRASLFLKMKGIIATLVLLILLNIVDCVVGFGFRSQKLKFRGEFRLSDSAALEYIQSSYPRFFAILRANKALTEYITLSNEPVTVFAPSSAAFAKLDGSIATKLSDPRNGEVVEKIAAYHVIKSRLLEDEIFQAAGIVTEGGEVPVVRSTSGGFMGLGAKEDGGVSLNGGKIVTSVDAGNCIVHETDGLINPFLLYRFLDAVRLPGT